MYLLAEASQAGSSGWIIAIVISILAGLVGALVLLNLNSIKSCIEKISGKVDKHDDRIEVIEKTVATRKGDCMADFASKEDWVRAEGYTRQMMEKQTATLNRLEGKLDFVKILPEMGAAMGKEIGKAITAELAKERQT